MCGADTGLCTTVGQPGTRDPPAFERVHSGRGKYKEARGKLYREPRNVPCCGGQKFRAFYKAGDQSRYPEIGVLEGEEAAKTEAESRRLEG